ncbi:hypothetical protein M404DRAFT_264552 [Pisolithus tinctorius Marx 270]|uniref:Uncharacterized protein n=1 Tax=Pisolithus tinctorius Marx 270 TaxID=870435 RepID=A0A0C3KIL2_PISTI|nr:hypothetical protein M404DRAFT_264552 [Pisolithus tinctorius Marx 270]
MYLGLRLPILCSELQSGSFFESLDESDLQFYRLYGQPVLIPSNDPCDGFALSNDPPTLHYPYFHEQWSLIASDRAPPPFKSYALVGSLGEAPAYQLVSPAIPSTTATYSHSQPAQQSQSPAQSMYSSTNPSEYPPIDNSYVQDLSPLSQYPNVDFSYVDNGDNSVAPMLGTGDSLMDHLPASSSSVSTIPSSYFQCSSPQDEKIPFEQTLPAAPQPPKSFTASSASESSDWTDSDSKTHVTVPSQAYPNNDPVRVNASVTYEQTPACEYTTSAQAPRRRTRSPSPRTHQQARTSLIPQHLHTKGKSMDKKPALACLFCRGRKIACGPPLPGTKDKTCK